MPIKAIRIFITGGTFDKEYNELNGQLFFEDTQMHDLPEMGRNKVPVVIRTLMMIDSLDMTTQDRELIVHQCVQGEETRSSLHMVRIPWPLLPKCWRKASRIKRSYSRAP